MKPSSRRLAVPPPPFFPLLILGYMAADLFAPFFLAGAGRAEWFWGGLFSGALFGQAGFLIIWAALGPFRLRVRWPRVLLIGFSLYFALCFGVLVMSRHRGAWDNLERTAAPLLVIPLLFLVLQSPLWIRRVISGWRIVSAGEAQQSSASEARQFGLGHLLGLTLLLAVALSLAQVWTMYMGAGRGPAGQVRPDIWFRLVAVCGVLCLYVAVWTGPSLRACFLAREKVLGGLAMVGVWLGVSVTVVMVMMVIRMASGRPPSVRAEIFGAVFVHFAGLAIVLTGSLHALRASGYVMTRSRGDGPPRSAGETDEPAARDVSPFAERAPELDPPASAETSDAGRDRREG